MIERSSSEIAQLWGLWHYLTPLEQSTLLQSAKVQSLPKFHVLFDEHEESVFLHILISGRLKITKTEDDDKQVAVCLMRDGEIIGEHLLDNPGRYGYCATTIDDSLVLSLRLYVIRSIVCENAAFCWEFSRLVLARLRRAEERMLNYRFNRTEQRLRTFLKEMAQYDSRKLATGDIEIKIPLSQALIGDMTATSRQQVTILLQKLEKRGLLRYQRRRLVIYRLDML